MERASTGTVVWVTPHGRDLVQTRGWSTRPAQLVRALAGIGVPVVVIARTRPGRIARAWASVAWQPDLGLAFEATRALGAGVRFLEHPAPAGRLERWQLKRTITRLGVPIRAVVVSDPRSAAILAEGLPGTKVFDAYDAWDLSPLYSGRPKVVAAIRRGYGAAARHAELVLANTEFMAERMAAAGARHVELLPNGCPDEVPRGDAPAEMPTRVIYVGNVQSRLRVDLLSAAADAAAEHGGHLDIIGAVQDEPVGWAQVLEHPAVNYRGARYGAELDTELAGATVGIIPHGRDDYTRSQDSMKAWDYLARGMAIVSTDVPPATTLTEMATIADDPASFRAAVRSALVGGEAGRGDRLRLARQHTWRHRAEAVAAFLP